MAFRGAEKQIKKEFGSGSLTSLLMSLMLKLAMKYLENWIEDRFFGPHVPRDFFEVK